MILRSLTRAVREQNYYAVFLEFLIVIVGIVVGFQVNEWAADRANREKEAVYLLRLNDAFDSILDEIQLSYEEIDAYYERTSNFLEGIRNNDRERAQQGAWGPYGITEIIFIDLQPAVLTELISTGDLQLISDSRLRAALASVPQIKANLDSRLSQRKSLSSALDFEVAVRFEFNEPDDGRWTNDLVGYDFDAIARDEPFLRLLGRALLQNRSLRGHLERREALLQDILLQIREEIAVHAKLSS